MRHISFDAAWRAEHENYKILTIHQYLRPQIVKTTDFVWNFGENGRLSKRVKIGEILNFLLRWHIDQPMCLQKKFQENRISNTENHRGCTFFWATLYVYTCERQLATCESYFFDQSTSVMNSEWAAPHDKFLTFSAPRGVFFVFWSAKILMF